MSLTCPGKVFILGEYTCMVGGPCILGAVEPRFELETANTPAQHLPFAKQSPAGLLLDTPEFQKLSLLTLNFNDPYSTPIGVGSSSAQFLLTLAAQRFLNDKPLPASQELLDLYWKTVGTSQGVRPSGADVISQWTGGFILFRNEPFTLKKLPHWNSESATFLLAYTGSKAKTHDHLKSLEARGFPEKFSAAFHQLNAIVDKAVDNWTSGDAKELGTNLNAYQEILFNAGIAPQNFHAQVTQASEWTGVFGAKGAGAQGGDCVLLLVDQKEKNSIKDKIIRTGWQPIEILWSKTGLTKE